MSVMNVLSRELAKEKRIKYHQTKYSEDGFQICKVGTKFTERFIKAYKDSTARSLIDVYKTYSLAKESAFQEYLNIRYKYDSYVNSGKIISHNINFFSYAFIGQYVSEDYDGRALFVITPSYRYIIPLYGEVLI